jgi:DUF1680 family protein
MTRRGFLVGLGAASLVNAEGEMPHKQEPLNPGELQLGNDLFGERYRLNARRAFGISTADLLMPFFRAKGISNGGKELNGEYAAKTQTGIWPGLYSTFWMSGAAHIARWTNDAGQKETLVRFVQELAKTREHDGYLLALGRDPGGRWAHADLYALVRSMVRGLLDIYETTGSSLALEMAGGQMDCLYSNIVGRRGPGGGITLRGTEGHPPVTSYYKLLPALSQLYLHTHDARWLEVADLCVDFPMIDALISGKQDPLPGRHASTWTDFLLGVYQIGLASGNPRYTQAAENAWKLICDQHLFITGSMSSAEHFSDGRFGWQLHGTQQAQETCCAGIWVAFLENLLHGTGDFGKADSVEQAAYNALFAAQDPEHGDFCYFLNLEGVNKPYDPPPVRAYHCCDGNGIMGIARLAGLIYGKTADGIAVNLYAASEARTQIGGGAVKITQTGNYPVSGDIKIRVEPDQPRTFALHLRIPSWAKAPQIQVNGTPVDPAGSIAREWRLGDVVTLSLPMGPEVLEDDRLGVTRIALQWGPAVLAGVWNDDLPVRQSRPVPPQGAMSIADVWPAVPSVDVPGKLNAAIRRVKSGEVRFEAEALPAAVLNAESGELDSLDLAAHTRPVRVDFEPFYSVTKGKYSIWMPVVQKL